MGLLDDILKALDRIPAWKRLQELPSEVEALRHRVTELEQKLGGKWPADVCRYCGERSLRLSDTFGPNEKGNMQEHWDCSACKQTDIRLVKPK